MMCAIDSFTFKNFVQTGVYLVEPLRFEERGLDKIVFELEDYFYMPTPPEEPQMLDVEDGYKPLGWCDIVAEQMNYKGDTKNDDDMDDDEGDEDNTQFREILIVEEESVDGDDGITQDYMDRFEGYQSKSDDHYFTDSELEPEHVRITSKEHLRDVFKEYAIQEGVELKIVKNDRARQTYECTGDGCGWRAHGLCMIDGVTFMIKTLSDHHDYHRVYNNKEAKVKWITSKFEKLVKSNSSIDVNVIGDLLKENYTVSVDMYKLYRAKHRALKELANEHANCFGYLRCGLFPLAVCICENETQDSLEWFLNNLKFFLNYPTNRNLTFMSDKQNGVIAALQIHFPFAHRRYCVRHTYAQFQTDLQRCDHVTNNMTEVFNNMLGTHRAASYLDLLEFIRRMVMRKFNKRKEECRGWSSVLPSRVHAKIMKHGRESRYLKMIATGNMKYELLDASGGYDVKLREYNCQCGSWQVSEIPCCHAMAVISHYCGRAAVKDKVAEFVHSSLIKSAYMQTYVGMIHLIPDQKRWPEVPACILILGHTEHMNQPPRTVQLGRPKKLRKREPDEAPKVGRSVIMKIKSNIASNRFLTNITSQIEMTNSTIKYYYTTLCLNQPTLFTQARQELEHDAWDLNGEYDWEIYWAVDLREEMGLMQVKEEADHHLAKSTNL
ncbi:hypothetical protein EZV62_004415 [Acer yangbiense]|uniref:SWIM-type domain-containing protein n=1 Tax=Acer yangbiense TaxID=1000413 RepID=A0A5C7IJT6_9ROSI|nr:hypothetical protein EZV62_004415 [Acer yangbiense]